MLRKAFTLIEILIAVVIMVVGITGIVALFPTAIKAGNLAIVDSYCSLITQSVVDAVNVGIADARYQIPAKPGEVNFEYFILEHDGVRDNPNQSDVSNYGTVYNKDFCILLPKGPANNSVSTQEMTLHSPIPKDKFSARRNPQINGGLNDETRQIPNSSGIPVFPVRAVYHLGRKKRGESTDQFPDNLRDEFKQTTGIGANQDVLLKDPYIQYGFAFSLRRERIDIRAPIGRMTAQDPFADSLLELRVKLFRNFNDDLASGNSVPRNNEPIQEFITFIAK